MYRAQHFGVVLFHIITISDISAQGVSSCVNQTATFRWDLPQAATSAATLMIVDPTDRLLFSVITSTNTPIIPPTITGNRVTYYGNVQQRNMTFTLSGVIPTDGGPYTCAAGSTSNKISGCQYNLTAAFPPDPATLTCNYNSGTRKINCTGLVSMGTPAVSLQIIDNNGNNKAQNDNDPLVYTHEKGDNGNFTCRIQGFSASCSDNVQACSYTVQAQGGGGVAWIVLIVFCVIFAVATIVMLIILCIKEKERGKCWLISVISVCVLAVILIILGIALMAVSAPGSEVGGIVMAVISWIIGAVALVLVILGFNGKGPLGRKKNKIEDKKEDEIVDKPPNRLPPLNSLTESPEDPSRKKKKTKKKKKKMEDGNDGKEER